MTTPLGSLFARFWNDDCGAVLTSEYLTLGSVVVLGGVAGLTSLRDAVNGEMKEFGGSIRSMRQSYSVPGSRSGNAGTTGSAAYNQGSSGGAVGNTAPPVNVVDCAL